MNEFQRLRKYFEEHTLIPDAEWDRFSSFLQTKKIMTGECFIRLGEDRQDIGFVLKGLFKVSYINTQGQKFIRNFCPEDNLISSYSSALQNREAEAEIQALENSEIIWFAYKDLHGQYAKHSCWQELGRKLAEKYFSFREFREYQLLTKKALERYEIFLQQFAPIAARIKQVDIAGYIGVTPESLSRLLKEKQSE